MEENQNIPCLAEILRTGSKTTTKAAGDTQQSSPEKCKAGGFWDGRRSQRAAENVGISGNDLAEDNAERAR